MLAFVFAAAAALLPQDPVRLGVLAADTTDGPDAVFVRGVKRAAEAIGKAGGVDGAKVELTFAPVASAADVAKAIDDLVAAGAAGVVASPQWHLAEAARKAAAGKLACVSFTTPAAALPPVLDRLIERTFCMTRVGLVRDKSKDAVEFAKQLAKGGLTAPTTLLWDFDLAGGAKAFAKLLEKDRPEVYVFDAEPAAVAQFLTQTMADDPSVVVLLPRAWGAPTAKLARRLFVVHGMSPGCVTQTTQFRADYERDHGTPGFAVAEGYDGVTALAKAVDAANARDAAAVGAALAALAFDGVRGRCEWDKALGAFVPALATWIVEGDGMRPYVPGVVALVAVGSSPGTAPAEARKPQSQVGEPFATWRTRQFVPEDGSQWVHCLWADDPGFATIADDLALLGIGTRGKDPLVDHLVREEILARVMAIASTKFGRTATGVGEDGKSLRIAFVAHVAAAEREKRRLRIWPARFGGDHADAGGQAFGTFCRVYSTFIRRTIFQPHALTPPLTSADRMYLDGTYAFGSDYGLDKRSELIRALIDGYAGAMALTLAHEVGHLAGLGHVTDDPLEIMNVDEGAGIGYREARFGQGSWTIMRDRHGLVGDKPGKGEKTGKKGK
jgi:ABC-type branched-subunit amino acid transport system substrate-binding protein